MHSQHQDPKSQPTSASREWMAGLALLGFMFVGLLLVAFWLGAQGKALLPRDPPIATLELGTARVEILKATYGDKAEWTAAPYAAPFAKKFMRLGTRRGNSWGISGMKLSTTFDDGRQTAFSASLDRYHLTANRTVPALGVLLRLSDALGKPLSSRYFQTQEAHQLIELTLTSAKQSTQRTTLPAEDLAKHGLMVEMEDGAGGWLPMNGPVFFNPEEGLAWALISTFPRILPELKLRFEYQKVVGTCVIKNPVPVMELPTWTVEKAPTLQTGSFIVRHTKDYDFEVKALGSTKGMAEGWMNPYVHLDNKGLRRPEFSIGWSLYDRMGNQLMAQRHGERDDAYRLLPGETQARLEVQVRPSAYHAWNESEVSFVAEGEWADITTIPVLKLTEEGRKLGYKDPVMVSWPVHTSSSRKPVIPPELEIDLEIKGEGSSADWSRLEADYENGDMALFEAADHSIGYAYKSGQGEGRRGSRQTWSHRALWKGIPTAGMRLRLGLIKRVVPDTHEFIFQVR
ncbi:MAG: hypothetical protein V4662_23495 [Verrucomicrobiota bacterium]